MALSNGAPASWSAAAIRRFAARPEEVRLLGFGARKISEELQNEGISYDERSVRRRLKEEKFFFLPPRKIQRLSKAHKKRRYAKNMLNADWKEVLFTDEKSFWLGQPSDSCWQQLDDRVEEELEQYTPKLHVWGSIGYYFKTDLHFFEENMNAALYQNIVSQRLPPNHFAPDCPERSRNNWHFLQDNDPKHKAKGSMKLLKKLTTSNVSTSSEESRLERDGRCLVILGSAC